MGVVGVPAAIGVVGVTAAGTERGADVVTVVGTFVLLVSVLGFTLTRMATGTVLGVPGVLGVVGVVGALGVVGVPG